MVFLRNMSMPRTPRTFCPALTLPSVSNPGYALEDSSEESRALLSRRLRIVHHTMPVGQMPPHCLILGTPGSGKTLTQKLFMASLLSDGGSGITYRAAVYDPKCELYPFFRNMGIAKEHLIVTHPFDTRCVAWHLPDDFTELAHAQTFAECFFPLRPKTSDTRNPDFWQNASNDVLKELTTVLIRVLPDTWELRDLTEICSEADTIKQVLNKTGEGQRACKTYFDRATHGDAKLPGSVLATIRSQMNQFQVVGTLLHNREAVFSINRWRNGAGIVLLGHDTQRSVVMQTFNNLLVKRMSEIVTHQSWPTDPTDHTWFFFDELVEAGEFEGFHRLLNFGRDKGVRIMLGFCDKAGLEKAFQDHEAVLALCDLKVFFHLGSAKTATWAADQCGIIPQDSTSKNISAYGDVSFHKSIQLKHRVEPHKFLDLPLSVGGHLEGFALSPGIGVFETAIDNVDKYLPPRIAKDHPTKFMARPKEDQEEKPWNLTDYDAVGIKPPPGYDKSDDDDRQPPRLFRL